MFHIRKLTKQISFLTTHECCSVFSLDNHDISWLIINLVFVFIMLLNEPRKFASHSSSRKNTQFCRPLQSVVFLFDFRNKHQKRSMRKLTVHLAKLLPPQLVIQSLGTKTAFDVPGSFPQLVWSVTKLLSSGQQGGGLTIKNS